MRAALGRGLGGGDGYGAVPPLRSLHGSTYPTVSQAQLDSFVHAVYEYWRRGGVVSIAVDGACAVALSLLTLLLWPILLSCVDYAALARCASSSPAGECGPLTSFLTTAHLASPRLRDWLALGLAAAHAGAAARTAADAVTSTATALGVRRVYRHALGVGDDTALLALRWDDVVCALA